MTGGVAVITGAARGLGKSFSEALLKRGHKVYLCDVDVKEGEKTQAELRKSYGDGNVQFQPCDVRKEQDFKAFFNGALQKFSSVDLMVNNAGILHEKEWRNCVDINLSGMIQGSLLAIDHMQQNNGGKGGVIINISSLAGVMPVPFCPVYSATKTGIVAFSRSWAMHPEIKKNGVRIACLCPSFANTDIVKGTNDKVQGAALANTVFNRYSLMTTERVTEAFLRVLDDNNNNGKVMIVTPTFMDYNTFNDPKL